MQGGSSAFTPGMISVRRVFAAVLLICCLIFIGPVAAGDITVSPFVSGDSYYNISSISGGYSVEIVSTVEFDTRNPFNYKIGVNITSPSGCDGITAEWLKCENQGAWGVRETSVTPDNVKEGNTITSTIDVDGTISSVIGSYNVYYYKVKIKAGDDCVREVVIHIALDALIKPMDLTIYANATFPKPRYEYYSYIVTSPSDRGFKVGDTFYNGDDVDNYPFTIYYYNRTTNERVDTPEQPGIYNAVIEPKESIQISDITYKRKSNKESKYFPVVFQNGTLTVLPTTKNVTLSPPIDPDDVQSSSGIFASFDPTDYKYLNGGRDTKSQDVCTPLGSDTLKLWDDRVYFLQDDLLPEEQALLQSSSCITASSSYEMKYFDLVVDNIWVDLESNRPGIYWPYPEGTDKNTEFTLYYFPDMRRSFDSASAATSAAETPDPVEIPPCSECHDHPDGVSSYHGAYEHGLHFCYWPSQYGYLSGPFLLTWKNTHIITFETNDGSPATTQEVSSGDPISEPANPVRDGHTFTGWHTDPACTSPWNFNTPVTQDMTLYAGWKQNEPGTPVPTSPGGSSGDGNMDNAFRVLFETNGGSTIPPQTDLSYGDRITQPADPVRDDHIFGGWYLDEDGTRPWNFEDPITGDMTLYAAWTREPVPTPVPTTPPTEQPTIEPTGNPTQPPVTEPTSEPEPDDDNHPDQPAANTLYLIGGIIALLLAILFLLLIALRHTVTFFIPAAGKIEPYRIKVWHGHRINPDRLPHLLRTAAWYRDPERHEPWDFGTDRVTKSIELYLG